MLKARTAGWIVALGAAACAGHGAGGGGTPTVSPSPTPTVLPSPSPSPVAPFACKGQALPSTAPDPITIDVSVIDESAGGGTLLVGATIDVFRTGNASSLGTATSNSVGDASVSVATGGTPIDGFVRGTKAAYLETDAYPAVPFSKDVSGFPVGMLKSTALSLLAMAAGATQSASNGFLAIQVEDCAGAAIAGATVSTNPGGTVRYFSGGSPSSSATSTDVDGRALVFDVPPGSVTISAVSGTNSLLQRVVAASAGKVTQADIAPGPL